MEVYNEATNDDDREGSMMMMMLIKLYRYTSFFFTVNIEDQLHLCIDELDNSPWSNCI